MERYHAYGGRYPEQPRAPYEEDGIENMGAFMGITEGLNVLAEASLWHKYMLVTGFKQMGYVVAMLGDEMSSPFAIKYADVGVSLGSGVDSVRDASDLILLNDDLHSFVKGLGWGHHFKDLMSRIVQYFLTTNIVALIIDFVCALAIKQVPITTI